MTAVGGGTLRDVLVARVPTVLRSDLYALPALAAAALTAAAISTGLYGAVAACTAAAVCFAIRMAGIHWNLHAPMPRPAQA